jgi:DNA-binding MarR family transcriptional regulator
MSASDEVGEKLDKVISLLQHLLALELSRGGVTQADIGKHLKIAKSSVVTMLRGYERGE